jgi:hypothetical protein
VTTSLGVDARWIAVLWLAPSLLLGLFAGLRTSVRQAKTSPNQGIWLTARNSIIIGLILGLIGALLVALTLEMSDPSPGDPISVEDILTSLPWLLGTVGVLAALPFGGLDVVQHFVLRIVLYLKGYIPWNYAQFLDYAAERIFLRKVGGGYIFIHRLLMEYFMELDAA